MTGTTEYEEPEEIIGGRLCVKCSGKALLTGVDPKKAVYCKDCFIQMVKNKFRSSLSKRKIFRDVESRKTLVVFDGTSSAAFLLHQVDDALRQINFKRLMIEPTILVLISVNEKNKIEEVLRRIEGLKSTLLPNVNFVCVHLAACLQSDIAAEDLLPSTCYGSNLIENYVNVLSTFKDSTYNSEVRRIFKETCIRKIGKALEINKAMVADDADELGSLSLSQMCLGRGGATSTLASVYDKREDFAFIRPLRDISKKEIAVVNHFCDYDTTAIHMTENSGNSSIQKLTDDFLSNLINEGFKSTINTVLSTVSKIHGTDEGSSQKCRCCGVAAPDVDGLCFTCNVVLSSGVDISSYLV